MDKTLFTPPMIETYKACPRAYHLAFGLPAGNGENLSSRNVCKKFMLKALAEINKGRITTVHQVQKFMGLHWPVDKLKPDEAVKAFLFAYKALTYYVSNPYRPKGAQVVGVSLKVRARVPHDRVYLEDTFDLIVWYPAERKLEFVDFHLNPLKAFNPAWPTASILVKQFLAERLQCRWPYEKLALTFCRIGVDGLKPTSLALDEALYRVHWPELLKTLDEIKDPHHHDVQNHRCSRCQSLEANISENTTPMYRTA